METEALKVAKRRLDQARIIVAVVATASMLMQFPASAQTRDGGALAGIQSDGLLQFDANWYQSDRQDLDGDSSDGADSDYGVRNAQVFVTGDRGKFKWVVGYEFESRKWLDVNLLGSFDQQDRHSMQAGQFKQPNSLEALSSSKTNDFMSQAMASNAFSLGRRLGLAYRYGDEAGHEAWGLTASYFGKEITDGLARGTGIGVRATWAHGQAGSRLHLGLSYANHDTYQDSWRVRARPNADLTPIRLVDSRTLVDTDRVATTGGEIAWLGDRVKVQAEYLRSGIQRYGGATSRVDGGYISGVWNFASGRWDYKSGLPVLSLKKTADQMVLWQVGARYDFIDLDDGGLNGGRAESLTLGVNAYFRSNLKVAVNYVQLHSERNGVADDPDILEARVQIHW